MNVTDEYLGATHRHYDYDGNRLRYFHDDGPPNRERYYRYEDGNLRCVTDSSTSSCPAAPLNQPLPVGLLEDFRWNGRDRLSCFRLAGQQTCGARYAYDPLDRIVTQNDSRGQTSYSYLGTSDNVSSETLTPGGTTKSYSYGPDDERVGMTDPSGDYYYARNVHADVSLLLSTSSGDAAASYVYKPYGGRDPLSAGDPEDGQLVNPYRFNDKRFDPGSSTPGSSTLNMGARLYNNDFGRFIQNDFQTDSSRDADLAGETLTQNRYAFAAANPLLYVETDGHGFCRRFPKLCQPPHSICHDPSSCQPRPRRWPSCPAGQRGLPLYYPYDRKLAIGKVDAGVDSKRHHVGPIFAIAGCTITKIDPVGSSSWGGLGAVYFRLDRPIHWGPRTYSKWYTAESSDRNRINNPKKLYVGKHFRAGQQILTTNSGWQETGFDAGQYMSDGPTGPGYDFRAFILFLRNRCYLAPGA